MIPDWSRLARNAVASLHPGRRPLPLLASRAVSTPAPPSEEAGGSDLDPALLAEGPREECGVFGVHAPGEEVAKLTYYGLYALQHRGQESAGMAVSDGGQILVTKDMGLVSQVFRESTLAALEGDLAIGHVRYSTTGTSSWANAQPQFRETPRGGQLALCHNGNLCNTTDVARMVGAEGMPNRDARAERPARPASEARAARPASEAVGLGERDSHSDSGLLASLLALQEEASLEEAILRTVDKLEGAFSLVIMDERRLYGVRDRHGVRPLHLGRLPSGGVAIASETAALDIIGAAEMREVEPGELVIVDEAGIWSRRFAEPDLKFCLFEWVYLARPDERQRGASVYTARRAMGRALARQAPVDADLVIPVPDSGTAAAAGYAEESGLPYAEGLVKNRYVGRTFIQPSQSLRRLGIRLKLNPLRSVIEGKRLVVVDDSIVRGNTSRELVRMLREAGAAEVHLRITSPPVRHPCYYGIDMATRAQLIAASMSVDEVARFVAADSLHYLSLDALIAATPHASSELCRACFDGVYPIPVAEEQTALAAAKFELEPEHV
ncbi:MAG: amidophosphoribosyltransferase [Actinomycetota bacterium]|nr:amidophosphoribosyltransferase [Actinomycetota bacterium]